MTLKSFPRGGKKPTSKPKSGLLFKRQDASEKPRKNRGKKSRGDNPPEEEQSYIADTAECLSYTSVSEGTILLGRIRATSEYEMIVSLPGRLSGKIPATDVSESYTNLLRNIVDSEGERVDEFKPLSELYNHGKYVVCCVKSVTASEKCQLSLSLEPEMLNRNLDPTKLRKGSKIIGTVGSIEDHGYVIDTGIDNLRCFLEHKDVDDGVKYYPGKQLFCGVKKVKTSENSTTAHLTTKSKHVATAIIDNDQSLDAQSPGTKFVLRVQKILSNGLRVSFNNDNVGYVNRIYLDKPLESYNRGDEIQGVLMYVMPTLKFAYFTLLQSDENKDRLNTGDIIEKAKVSFIGPRGVVVTLKKEIRGWIPFRRTEVAYERISSVFAVNTSHKCRVMAYDMFEQMYICTMESKLLMEKHFGTASFVPGERVKVEIAEVQPEKGGITVTAGRTTGWVPAEYIKDPEVAEKAQFKAGDKVDARVLGLDKRQKGILFILNKCLVESTLPVLTDFADVKIGAKHHGAIMLVTDKGLLVRFYNDVKGWLPSKSLNNKNGARSRYTIGQVITVRIEKFQPDGNKLSLSLCTNDAETKEEYDFEIGENVEGTVVEASVEGVYLSISKSPEAESRTGFLPAGHLSPCEEIGSYLAARYVIGERISALVFSTKPRFLLTRTFVPREEYRNFKKLRVGHCLPCSINEITEDGLKVVLPISDYDSYGNVIKCNTENLHYLHVNQILFAKIASIDHKNRKINLVTSLHDVWNDDSSNSDNDLIASVDVLSLYLSKLRELSENDYYKRKSISRVKIGDRVEAIVDKVTEHGLVLKLNDNISGTVRPDHYRGTPKPGDTVNGTIYWINYVHEFAEITLLPKMINAIGTKQARLPKISIETQLRGDIVSVTNWFALVVLKGAGKGILAALPTRRHINDVEPDLTPYSIGKRIRCYVVLNQSETGMLPICLVKSAFETKAKVPENSAVKNLKRKSDEKHDDTLKKMKKTNTKIADSPAVDKTKKKKREKYSEKEKVTPAVAKLPEEETSRKRKRKKATANEETKDSVMHAENKLAQKRKLANKTAALETKTQAPGTPKKTKQRKSKLEKMNENQADSGIEGESVEGNYSDSDDDDGTGGTPGIPECGFFWDNKPDDSLIVHEESSSDDEDDQEDTKNQSKKRKKLNAAERREAEKQKEREIREREEALARNEAPNSVDQFDRLVLASPDSSIIWVQYMAYHLQATEIEKARAVAKRAIKTINFREENERLNVWQAWLNLESRFGTTESLSSVFQDAVRTNDARSVYLHMLTVHADAGRQAELEKIVTTVLGKFKQVPQIWYEAGAAFLKIGSKDKSRHTMQRALQSLPPQEHVNLMVKFAQLENKHGDKERAQTLFEQILSSYPKRVDVWSSYVDTLVKSDDLDSARKVLEKAVVQTLPARKMKTLFKKFIDFERKHGTPENVSHVQQLALKYVENECNKDPI